MLAERNSSTDVRERLLARQREVRARAERLQADRWRDAEALSTDAPDRAVQQENDEVIDSLVEAVTAESQAVAAALRRVEEGSYGICETCAGPISEKRLAAVPCAEQCQSCAGHTNS